MAIFNRFTDYVLALLTGVVISTFNTFFDSQTVIVSNPTVGHFIGGPGPLRNYWGEMDPQPQLPTPLYVRLTSTHLYRYLQDLRF